jgi:hypothetical protein
MWSRLLLLPIVAALAMDVNIGPVTSDGQQLRWNQTLDQVTVSSLSLSRTQQRSVLGSLSNIFVCHALREAGQLLKDGNA